MALGNSAIAKLSGEMYEVAEARSLVLEDCWNTFQYVVNNIEAWADETTIGNEPKTSLMKLVDNVKYVNDGLDKLYKQTLSFRDQQERINRG